MNFQKKINYDAKHEKLVKDFLKKNEKISVDNAKPNKRKNKRLKKSKSDFKKPENLAPYSHKLLGKSEYQKFYSSKDWRQLRYLALSNCQGRCQCCGASASNGVVLHVDHIKPRSRYPELELSLSNIQVLCEDCNIGKGDWGLDDWREHWKTI